MVRDTIVIFKWGFRETSEAMRAHSRIKFDKITFGSYSSFDKWK